MKMQGYPKARLIIAIVTILLFVASVTVGILNIVGIIKGPWYSILFFVFAALSTTAVFQKLPSPSSEEPSKLISTTVNGQVSDINKGHVQVEGIDLGVNEFTGALVVYAKKTMVGVSVDLRRNLSSPLAHSTSNVVQRRVNNEVECTAVFPRLEPSDYIVNDASGNYSTRITVLPGLVTEIDWRRIRPRKAASKKEGQLPN